jgi:hypothetical protein
MSKLIKPIFCILFILAFSYKGFGQQRHVQSARPLAPRYGPPPGPPQGRVPVQVQRNYPINRQPWQGPGAKIEVVKEGYIGIRLRLTPDEARAFWPLYREYIHLQTAVRIAKRLNNSKDSPDGIQQTDKELEYETDLVNIRKHYRDEFLRILPPQKVSELYKSEREFNDEVLRQLSERNGKTGN